MKEVTCNTFSPGYIPFDFVFDIPETETTKSRRLLVSLIHKQL